MQIFRLYRVKKNTNPASQPLLLLMSSSVSVHFQTSDEMMSTCGCDDAVTIIRHQRRDTDPEGKD